jgi:CRISPR/Cas system-associated endonuclease Cas3-HD
MLRVESDNGWWLITHPDHAQLAASFAAHWGNDTFASPEPRSSVLRGIRAHDDGWAARDAHPKITREGKPSAFSHELVGKYSAFEKIDLADYLAVRESALAHVEKTCSYAALLISMHTSNLLSVHADRSTIAAHQLPLLDAFLERQLDKQQLLRANLRSNSHFSATEVEDNSILNNFRLLQATDNLSLYGCVGYTRSGNLLHPLPTTRGDSRMVEVFPIAPRHFRLKPYPLDEPLLSFTVPARHVEGKVFANSEELEKSFAAAALERLTITVSA